MSARAKRGILLLPLMIAACAQAPTAPDAGDPYAWLEDVNGARPLEWVKATSAVASRELEAEPGFKQLEQRLLSIYDSKDKIPYVDQLHGGWYNFWQDADHVRGIWRRTTPAEYRKAAPHWETVLDVDALGAADKVSWVWKGYTCLHPDYSRCLVSLSRGGGDAVVVREFDLLKKEFVADGFNLPEAKSLVAWRNLDTIYVGTDFGPGSLTDSGYPRIVKEWRRGTPLAAARTVYEGKTTDVAASAFVSPQPDGVVYEGVVRTPEFYKSETLLRRGDELVKLDLPEDADTSVFRDQGLVQLRKDWSVGGKTYPAGSLLAIPLEKFLAGDRNFATLYEPGPRKSLVGFTATRNVLIVNELDNVATRLYTLRPGQDGWRRKALKIPKLGTVSVWGVDPLHSDDYFMTVTDYVTPTQLLTGTLGPGERKKLKQQPTFFDASGLQITQHEAVSKDGTRIPYFQVSRKGLALDGKTPTVLYGYGGFEVSELPYYSGGIGAGWLERGGVFVVANIRGGGEFGPAWHQAALKANRQRAYDDFIAVAEDLTQRRVTSPQHLGIWGGSNGGLLVGVMFTQRPELFGAVACEVPLLDMKRYNHLLAGASWMAEYGDPDKPEEWAYISAYSPYHNVVAGRKYPRVLFTTSTHDDRVHPGHARKMTARMLEQGHDVLYYENTEGGHAGAANNKQRAYMTGLALTFLWKQLQ
jgi:prolyl oligopeptidase